MPAGTPSARDRGVQLFREGLIEKSITFLAMAIEESPNDVDLYLYLGVAYAYQGDLSKTVDILESAASLSPKSARVHYNLGVAFQKANNPTRAREEYLRTLGIDPFYTAAKTALDVLLENQSSAVSKPQTESAGGDKTD